MDESITVTVLATLIAGVMALGSAFVMGISAASDSKRTSGASEHEWECTGGILNNALDCSDRLQDTDA